MFLLRATSLLKLESTILLAQETTTAAAWFGFPTFHLSDHAAYQFIVEKLQAYLL